ncbi:MAG: hypothetical protein AAGJ83_15440, partial [Planctomycetota bacterium]
MRHVTLLMAVVTCLVAPIRPLAADGPDGADSDVDILDLVPAAATAAIAIRNASELAQRGDTLIDETDIQVPMRFSDAFGFLLSILRLEKGVDRSGSFVLFAVDAKGLESLALAVPIDDVEAMAENLGIPNDQFVEGNVIDLADYPRGEGGTVIRYVAVRQQHLFVGLSRKTVKLALTAPRLRGVLPEGAAKTLVKDDILIYARDETIKELLKDQPRIIDMLARSMVGRKNAAEQKALSKELKQLTLGIRLDGGVGASLVLDFEGERSKEYLTELGTANAHASLVGLPDGKILAAQSFSSRGEAMAVMVQSLFVVALNGVLSVSGDDMSFGHRSNLADLFGLGWKSCDETRVALYENVDPSRHGWFSFLAILETDDAEQFVQDMVDLAPFMHASRLTATERD